MIQILTYKGNEDEFQGNEIKVNRIHDAESLDSFDVNIISLRDNNMWESQNASIKTIDSISDLKSLSTMIYNSKQTKIVILLPQNIKYRYNRRLNSRINYCELKNMIYDFSDILGDIYEPIRHANIVYENTTTKIGQNEISAAFYFNTIQEETVLTKSERSNKPTTIIKNDIILSSLDINNSDEIDTFMRSIGLVHDKLEAPEWMEDVKMFDDNTQLNIIKKNNDMIKAAHENISKAMEVIDKNNRYKSILYTTGNELVEVVFEILQEMLGCDLSEFTDKKKEDFKFTLGDKVFIGEIKGVTPNVKKANVSQLDVHVQEYMDDNDEQVENIIALLIIDHQRGKAIAEREKVHEEVIKLAERNGSLIVDTMALLRLFEQYTLNEKSREECIELLESNTGLLEI
ncbi:MAG: hypothetical protein KHY81_00205 [Lachnospiraceae bacterium]|nr:hypothetical protein [Lachnospiraceae bacterium]